MKNSFTFNDEEDQALENSPFYWWRTAIEFKDPNGFLRMLYVSPDHLSSSLIITPRFKLLMEVERLAFISQQGLDELRHKLITYKPGDLWLPIGGMTKEDMQIPHTITVLLVGLSGSGKSSLVNLMYSVLGRSGLIPFAQTSNGFSNYTTMFLEEHNVLRSKKSGFCVFDSRGLDYNKMGDGLEEVSRWMATGIRHNQPCCRPGDKTDGPNAISSPSSEGFAKRTVNYVLVVANLAEIYKAFFCGGNLKPVSAVRSLFRCPAIRKSNENPILILTHGDMLLPEERINGRLKICDYLGIPATTGAYDIACLTEKGILPEKSDPVTSFALAEVMYRVLMQADRIHVPKWTYKDWLLDLLSRIMCSIACFFAMLSRLFSEWGEKQKLK